MTTLGDEMKAHELVTRTVLPSRVYTILRVDGRAFHTLTRGLKRPFDESFANAMNKTAVALLEEVQNAQFAYVQSDEISLCVANFNDRAEPWFGGQVQKMVSISAARASVSFTAAFGREALFDSRVFTLAQPEDMSRYFMWRQRDAIKNSISMTAQAHFSHKELQGLNGSEMRDKLVIEKDVFWDDVPNGFRMGRWVTRHTYDDVVQYERRDTGKMEYADVVRSKWVVEPAPNFTDGSAIMIYLADGPLHES